MALGQFIPKLAVLQATPIVDPETGMATVALTTHLQAIMDRIGGSSSAPLTTYLSAQGAASTYLPFTGGTLTGPVTATVFNGAGTGLTGTALALTAGNAVTINGGIQNANITWTNQQAFSVSPVFGAGIRVSEGANAKQGTATLILGTVTVANTSVTATSRIFLSRQALNASTAVGHLSISARTPGTSFTLSSYKDATVGVQAGDLSTVSYLISEVG